VEGYGRYSQLGQTLDDAAGEAFDKVAKILGLGYPGGLPIERQARDGRVERIVFPRAYMAKDSLDFSFSGLKTAVSLFIKKWREGTEEHRDVTLPDIAASFQESVVDVLVHKVMEASKRMGVSRVVVAGGVACNNRLRVRLLDAAAGRGVRVFFPGPVFCTDNGAMIALAGFHRLMSGEHTDLSIDARSKFPIQDLLPANSDHDR
jgi:N6-L-threonylcarbamoyladenine synthase